MPACRLMWRVHCLAFSVVCVKKLDHLSRPETVCAIVGQQVLTLSAAFTHP